MQRCVVATLFLAGIVIVTGGCSSAPTRVKSDSSLDTAIAHYIHAEYDKASDLLVLLSRDLEGEEELQTVYLYLGRCHLALKEYEKAAAAFSNGQVLGGGVVFDEYLAEAQQHLQAVPQLLDVQDQVTRGQMASLLVRLVNDDRLSIPETLVDVPADLGHHWARDYAEAARAAGLMSVLPDGRFHPDRALTRASFLVVLFRVAGLLGDEMESARARIAREYVDVLGSGDADRPVSGREAVHALESLTARSGL